MFILSHERLAYILCSGLMLSVYIPIIFQDSAPLILFLLSTCTINFFLPSLCTINMLSSPTNAPSSFVDSNSFPAQVTTISEKTTVFHSLFQEWVCFYFSLRTLTIGQCPVEVVQVDIIVHLRSKCSNFHDATYLSITQMCVH